MRSDHRRLGLGLVHERPAFELRSQSPQISLSQTQTVQSQTAQKSDAAMRTNRGAVLIIITATTLRTGLPHWTRTRSTKMFSFDGSRTKVLPSARVSATGSVWKTGHDSRCMRSVSGVRSYSSSHHGQASIISTSRSQLAYTAPGWQ